MGSVRLRLRTPGVLLERAARPAPARVRVGRYEVRDPQAVEGQAPSWLRGDERAGRAAAWLLLAFPRDRISHAAVAGRRGTGAGERGGWEEGLRDHGRRAQVPR